ncbi:hypothetical protein E0H86_12855 [Acinetobacter sp. ANC 4635]|uniref:chalcone isomerase family protein n=1 Tax=Acinetobacter sp. ANC 4635 TaxID=2529846 RepID=UPI00103DBC92|nr:chalcone isomerase family protein [Acinetobacter sp. ANC 4635]TCB26915.1 hypothetical protein E0H86_12855 [Acinetobacter sp. ANC 4635]
MDFAFQKYTLILTGILLQCCISSNAATLKQCSSAPLMVSKNNVGHVNYFAESCQKAWDNQSIQLDFSYERDIPGWAFKQAATYFLKKNVTDNTSLITLNKITEWYQPVKKGDLYRLNYQHSSKKMTLSLNNKVLGQISDPQINQYFKIWFGHAPFNAKLRQQLLN